MEGDGKGEDAPCIGRAGEVGEEEETSAGAVDIGFARIGYGAQDLSPVGVEDGKLGEEIPPGEPLSRVWPR